MIIVIINHQSSNANILIFNIFIFLFFLLHDVNRNIPIHVLPTYCNIIIKIKIILLIIIVIIIILEFKIFILGYMFLVKIWCIIMTPQLSHP